MIKKHQLHMFFSVMFMMFSLEIYSDSYTPAIFKILSGRFSICTSNNQNSECESSNQNNNIKLLEKLGDIEKPKIVKTGLSQSGRYVQFTFDLNGFLTGISAGALFRLLYSVSTCGTKYETFKSAVVRPGIAKSALFWVPAIFAYKSIVNDHQYEALRQKLDYLANDLNDRAEKIKQEDDSLPRAS